MSTSTSSQKPATNICSPLSCTQPITSGASGRRPGRRSPPPASPSATRRRQPRLRRCSAVPCTGSPAATASPGFLCSRMPADRSTGSPFLSRPAPSATAVRPTSSASSDVHVAGCRAPSPGANARADGSRVGSSTTAGVAALPLDHLPQLFARRARCERRAHFRSGLRFARPPGRRAAPSATPARTMSADRSAGPLPLKHLDALGNLDGVADGAAERRIHARDERFGANAGGGADRRPATAPARAHRPAAA